MLLYPQIFRKQGETKEIWQLHLRLFYRHPDFFNKSFGCENRGSDHATCFSMLKVKFCQTV